MIPHLDPCLTPSSAAINISSGILTNNNGEYTKDQIAVFEKEFKDSIVREVETNPLSKMVKEYGNDFYDVHNYLNQALKNNKDKLNNFGALSERTDGGKSPAITPAETAAMMDDYGFTVNTLTKAINERFDGVLTQLDGYYRDSFSSSIMGGFCGLFQSAFVLINGFFNLVGQVQGLISDAISFVNKIKNIEDAAKAFFEQLKVKALIEAIKKKIVDTVEGVIKSVVSAIENFDIGEVVNDIGVFIQENIINRVEDIKNGIVEFFSDENIEGIKNKITGLFDYAVGLFENPSLEEIQFLILRICGFAAGVEGLIKGTRAPLDDFQNRYREVFNNLQNASNRIEGESIRAGAIRFSEPRRKQVINNTKEEWANIDPDYQYQITETTQTTTEDDGEIPVSKYDGLVEQMKSLPKWKDLKNGKDSRFKVEGDWVKDLGADGWNRILDKVKLQLQSLQKSAKEAGITDQLIIMSGWRSQEYNKKQVEQDPGTGSHSFGLAVDVTWDDFYARADKTDEFAELAKKAGFRNIGMRDKFIHLGMGQTNYWDVRTQ